jgi:hypothetical protein
MNAVISLPNSFRIAAVVVCCLGGAGAASAESAPDTENGRYTLSPAGDGAIIRLDTRTGTVSNCNNSGAGWACYAVPDERTAMDAEIGRLQTENEKLKARLASRDGTVEGKIDEPLPKDALPKSDKQGAPKVAEGDRKIEIPLPSDQDMDRVMSFVERAWRRLVDMANRIQKDAAGKI